MRLTNGKWCCCFFHYIQHMSCYIKNEFDVSAMSFTIIFNHKIKTIRWNLHLQSSWNFSCLTNITYWKIFFMIITFFEWASSEQILLLTTLVMLHKSFKLYSYIGKFWKYVLLILKVLQLTIFSGRFSLLSNKRLSLKMQWFYAVDLMYVISIRDYIETHASPLWFRRQSEKKRACFSVNLLKQKWIKLKWINDDTLVVTKIASVASSMRAKRNETSTTSSSIKRNENLSSDMSPILILFLYHFNFF